MLGHRNPILCLTANHRLMYTGSADTTAKCWTTELGDCTRVYKKHTHSVICLKFDRGICELQLIFILQVVNFTIN